MKATSFLSALALGVGTTFAQKDDVFEASNFDITEALVKNGVNISAIPQLSGSANTSLLGRCLIACESLKLIYGTSKLLSKGTSNYETFTGRYWSAQQGAVSPRCIFVPSAALEVSSMVLLSRLTQCPFAVKGGGHAAFGGASSIEGGITVSMENFKQMTVSKDKTTVDVGPGNRWVDVYNEIGKFGIGVVGGRMAPVGVPGLILGGGISFFSNKLGWACDNVAAYEVVTASGVVVTATPTLFPDLYWALRGGGNNFGIVTNFKLNAFPLSQMWGGQRIFTENNFVAVLDAIYKFATTGSSADTDAATIVSFGDVAGIGRIAIVQMHYTRAIENATVFSDLNAIAPVISNTALGSLANMAVKMNEGSTDGLRQTQWDVTFKVDRELFAFLVNTFYSLYPSIQNVSGALPTISIQAITTGQLKGMQKNGGNALGIDASKGPLFIMNMSCRWTNATDDAVVLKFFSTIIKNVKEEAKKKGVDNQYIYMNYASQFEDPISSYGQENLEKLRKISRKYDPQQVFQDLHPGHFKLNGRAPDPNMP